MAEMKADGPLFDVSAVFEQELLARKEDLRREATLRMFSKLRMFAKLHPNSRVTVEQFLSGLRQHSDVWAVVSTMGVLDFATSLAGRSGDSEQLLKNSLKGVIVNVLAGTKDGLTRWEIAKHTREELLDNVGVSREELVVKLRQSLAELVADGKIHTVREKQRGRWVFRLSLRSVPKH